MFSTNVNTPTDLMSIALQAEREAIRRYTRLAKHMREGNNDSAATLFERLIAEEQQHEKLLLKWMEQEGITNNPNIGQLKWVDPQVSKTYNNDAQDAAHSSPYRALAFAVHNEEMAFAFYTHVAANSNDEVVCQHAEILAREELGHAALLRAERRIAYHQEREANMLEPQLDYTNIYNNADLLTAAIYIDRYLVEQMQALVKSTPQLNSLTLQSQQQITDNEKTLQDIVNNQQSIAGEDISNNLQQLKLHNAYMKQKFNQPNQELQRLWACCDRSFAFYDAVVETTSDENIMLTAQQLTSSALDRIGVLKQLLENLDS